MALRQHLPETSFRVELCSKVTTGLTRDSGHSRSFWNSDLRKGPTDETLARGSSDCPCRVIRLVNFPRDGHAPSDCASGSDAFPPKSCAARSGIDEAMGPWLCPQEGDVLLLAHLTVHMDPECVLTRRTYPLRMCYCVTKLHRCFHYDVDSDFVLHSNCRCSENVDVATDKFWPVVTMCRRCSPFPEGQNDGNSPAH